MAAPGLHAVPAAERETVESANKYGIDPSAYPAYFHSSSCPASSNRLFGFANQPKPPFVLQRYDEPRDLRPCAETAELLGTVIQRRSKMPEKQADVQVNKIDFDTDNPRIKKALEKYGGQLTPQQIHFALRSAANGPASSFSSLKDSIRASKGILSPITLIRRAERYICIDGNTRLAIYREFDKENVAGDWSRIKSLIIEGATQPDIEMRRVSAHLVGAREWPAYEKARYLHYLRNEKLWDYGRLIELCGGNKAEIERQIDAYHDMNEFYRDVVDDTAFQIDRFSGFVELQKPRVKQAIFGAGLRLEDFGEWIRDGKIYRLEDTRKLPQVLADDEARNIFLSGGPRSIEDAVRTLEQKRPEGRKPDKLLLKDTSIAELADALVKRINDLPYSEISILRNRDREESREQVAALEDLAARLGGLLRDVAE